MTDKDFIVVLDQRNGTELFTINFNSDVMEPENISIEGSYFGDFLDIGTDLDCDYEDLMTHPNIRYIVAYHDSV